jgi:uncharacterized protein (DUF1499 family)
MWKRIMLIGSLVVLFAVVLAVGGLAVLSLTARRPDNLGATDGKLAACPDKPNCVASQADDAAHHAEPLRFTTTPGVAWARLVRVVTAMPRVTVVTADDDYLHAEFASLLFRFTDDVEFVLDPENQVIHFRSAARVGHSDMGVNRERIEAIRAAFDRAD